MFEIILFMLFYNSVHLNNYAIHFILNNYFLVEYGKGIQRSYFSNDKSLKIRKRTGELVIIRELKIKIFLDI